MITYNHERYIANAIESVLSQRTNFRLELVIGEDCSTDETAEICRKYADANPDIIQLITEPKNLGPFENGIKTLARCRGKYIAWCEGDDFWTDNLKLQKQVDLLERNPEASFCFTKTNVKFETETNDHLYLHMDNYPSRITLSDYLESYYPIPMLTKVSRKSISRPYWEEDYKWLNAVRYHDNAQHMLDLMKGPGIFLNEITATYRVQPNSLTRTASKDDPWHVKEILYTHSYFANLCEPEFKSKYVAIRLFHFEKLLDFYIARKNTVKAVQTLFNLLLDSESGKIVDKFSLVFKIFRKHKQLSAQ